MLTDILRTVDDLGVFQKYSDNDITPFLLVNGHQRRSHTTFLKYITNELVPGRSVLLFLIALLYGK